MVSSFYLNGWRFRGNFIGTKFCMKYSCPNSATKIDYFSEIATAVVCEDVLSEKVCKSLRDAAKKFGEKVEIIDQLVREAVKDGITKASEIIKRVQEKIIEFATDFKCEDALSKKVSPILNQRFI